MKGEIQTTQVFGEVGLEIHISKYQRIRQVIKTILYELIQKKHYR